MPLKYDSPLLFVTSLSLLIEFRGFICRLVVNSYHQCACFCLLMFDRIPVYIGRLRNALNLLVGYSHYVSAPRAEHKGLLLKVKSASLQSISSR